MSAEEEVVILKRRVAALELQVKKLAEAIRAVQKVPVISRAGLIRR